MLWMFVNYMLFGLNATWWHLTTILVHLGATFMVYLLARRLLKDQWTALITALIFGLHPVHIEAVAWAAGVTEPLLALFLIPAFLFYLNWRESDSSTETRLAAKRKRRKWLGASLAFYAVAIFEKETALVLPMLVFVYEWIYSGGESQKISFAARVRNCIKVAAPYLALSVVISCSAHDCFERAWAYDNTASVNDDYFDMAVAALDLPETACLAGWFQRLL